MLIGIPIFALLIAAITLWIKSVKQHQLKLSIWQKGSIFVLLITLLAAIYLTFFVFHINF